MSTDSLLARKYTLPPQSANIIELIGSHILGLVDANDLRNIADPAICKKYVTLIASKLQSEMDMVELRIIDKSLSSDKLEKVLYKVADSSQSVCTSFGFYIMRILQLVYIALCHISKTAEIGFDATLTKEASTVSLGEKVDSMNDFKDRIRKFFATPLDDNGRKILLPLVNRSDPRNVDALIDMLAASVSFPVNIPTLSDPRLLFNEDNEFEYWVDFIHGYIGFTVRSTKKMYNLFKIESQGKPKVSRDMMNKYNIKFWPIDKTDGKKSGPYYWYGSTDFYEEEKDDEGKKKKKGDDISAALKRIRGQHGGAHNDDNSEIESIHMTKLFSDNAKKILAKRTSGDDDSKLILKKDDTGGASVKSTTEIIFSNPVYALQDAMLVDKVKLPLEHAYEFNMKSMKEVLTSSVKWMNHFVDILYGDTYQLQKDKELTRTFNIVKNKIVWNNNQTVISSNEIEYQYSKKKISDAFAVPNINAVTTETSKKLTNVFNVTAPGHGALAKAYVEEYEALTKMQNQIAKVAAQMLFNGAFGLPQLVIYQSTERGRMFKINPLLINIGTNAIEDAYKKLRTIFIPYYEVFAKHEASIVGIVNKVSAEVTLTEEQRKEVMAATTQGPQIGVTPPLRMPWMMPGGASRKRRNNVRKTRKRRF